MIEKNKNGIIVVVLLATFFGLVSGVVGSLTVKSYLGTNTAFWGELDFINGNLERPNVVISGAKKVVVAQDEKITETINQVSSSLVGIYLKKATSSLDDSLGLDYFYLKKDELGSGLIVTSDGWIITDIFDPLDFSSKNNDFKLEKYVVVTNEKNILNIDKIEFDPLTNYAFIHVDARDLPVLSIASKNDLGTGETVFGLNSEKKVFLSTISSVRDYNKYTSISSDYFFDKISLVDRIDENFYSSFIFDISGKIVLFVDKKGEFIPSRVFNSAFESLFVDGVIERPSLGLRYADLSHFVYYDSEINSDTSGGSLVLPYPKTGKYLAKEAGIEEGDLIKSVNGVVLDENNSFAKIVMDHLPGDELTIGLIRNKSEVGIKLKLGNY